MVSVEFLLQFVRDLLNNHPAKQPVFDHEFANIVVFLKSRFAMHLAAFYQVSSGERFIRRERFLDFLKYQGDGVAEILQGERVGSRQRLYKRDFPLPDYGVFSRSESRCEQG